LETPIGLGALKPCNAILNLFHESVAYFRV